jgi:tRNA(Ile)-lysidine synthase
LEPGLIRIPRNVLRDAPPAVQQALARRAVLETAGDWNDLAYRHVIRIIEFAKSPTATRRMDLALGVEVALEYDGLVFRSPARMSSAPAWELANLPVPGNLSIRYPDWTLETVLVDAADLPEPDSPPDPWTVWIDRDRVRLPFLLRKRRAGDRFFPLGMPGAVRLNDFLASHHLPFSERDRWPLVCDSDGIIWVPGFRIKEGINPTDRSSGCIKIHINRTP